MCSITVYHLPTGFLSTIHRTDLYYTREIEESKLSAYYKVIYDLFKFYISVPPDGVEYSQAVRKSCSIHLPGEDLRNIFTWCDLVMSICRSYVQSPTNGHWTDLHPDTVEIIINIDK